MPSGEVFTGPHERSANGTIRFDVPTCPRGVEVTDVELTFENGEVVEATADGGDEYLEAALATDAGARFLGELGIGTNAGIDRATGTTLLDEKMAGTVHLALGRSYPETGGTNVSALHWDLICDLRSGRSAERRRRADRRRRRARAVNRRAERNRSRCVGAPTQLTSARHDAPHQDRRHDRTRVTRSGDAAADGRGRAWTSLG